MKTVKSMFAGIALLFICISVNAALVKGADKLTKEDAINKYVDAIANGKTGTLNAILSDDLVFNMQRGNNLNSLSKDQFIDYMKANATVDPSVTTSTTDILDDSGNALIKVEFKYDNYTRVDLLTLSSSNRITKVDSSFK